MKYLRMVLGSLALAGCGSGPDDPAIVSYEFDMSALGSDTTPERILTYDCVASGNFLVPTPVEPSGTVELRIMITRSLHERRGTHQEFTSADTLVDDATLAYSGLRDDNLSFSLTAGSYTVTPPSGALVPAAGEYHGDWSCGPDFPLAQDSTLAAYGYDSSVEIPGTWRIFEILPID